MQNKTDETNIFSLRFMLVMIHQQQLFTYRPYSDAYFHTHTYTHTHIYFTTVLIPISQMLKTINHNLNYLHINRDQQT